MNTKKKDSRGMQPPSGETRPVTNLPKKKSYS